MATDNFFLAKATECEANASRMIDTHMREQWLRMARDWRALVKDRTLLTPKA